MVLKHKQRLSVLLFLSSYIYIMVYISTYTLINLSYLISVDLLSISSSAFSVCLIFDKTSLGFSGLVTFISGAVFLFARNYMSSDNYYWRFIWILLSFVLSMNVLILSGSYLTLLVGWDGLGVSSFMLIIYYQSKDSLVAGFLTLLINRLGDIIIMSLIFYFSLMGMTLLINYPQSFQYYMLMILSVGALTKSAQYPFGVWLPAAMAAPTPVSALVHSSTLVTAGIYIIIRGFSSMDLPCEVMSLLLFCGSVTSLLGGLCALVENDLKKIIAFSTLSQLGVMVFSLGLGSYSLALLHLYTHAMFKALLFLVAGVVLMLSFGVQDIRLLGAVTRKAPMLLAFMNISAFCLMGLPFLSAFYSKHVILSLMWSSLPNTFAVIIMLLSTGLTGLYMVRLLKCINWTNQHCTITLPSFSWFFYLPMYLLFVGSLCSGMLFTTLDDALPTNIFLTTSYDWTMNLVILVSLLLGCLMINRYKWLMLTNMFYMVPLWYNSTTLYFHLSSKLKYLDHGWLEPQCMEHTLRKSTQLFLRYTSWPVNSFNTLPYITVVGGLYFSIWICLK